MHRNTPANMSQGQQRSIPYDPRVLPMYQRLLTPTNCEVYPYQAPPPENGMNQPGLFMIDKGRKSIKIAGASSIASQTQPNRPHHVNIASSPNRTVRMTRNPSAPDAYSLLVQVLGKETKSQVLPRTHAAGDSRVMPPNAIDQMKNRTHANSAVSSTTRVVVTNSQSPRSRDSAPSEKKKKSASDDFSDANQRPVTVRTYHEHHKDNSPSPKTRDHSHSAKSGASHSAAHAQGEHKAQHGLTETPKASKDVSSDSVRESRKRTHDTKSAQTPIPKPDTSNPSGKALDRISEAIWQNYLATKQNTPRLYMKENLRQTLETMIQTKYPGSMLFLVGSSLNGFATNSSDTDLCLMVSSHEVDQKRQATYILNCLQRLVLQRSNFVTNAIVIHATVPILKFVCTRTFDGLDCDININNATGIRNTHLLQTYAKIDWRVAPMVTFIKQWASAQDINDASQGTLSSYSLVLMVLNYLQVKCKPCVLPCLHQLHSNYFNSQSDVRFLYDTHPSNPLPSYITFRSKNTESIWDLIRGFFKYYVDEFRFQSNVICVRLGTTYPVVDAPYTTRDWIDKCIYIEEPFDGNNTARAVYNASKFRKVMQGFDRTHRRLKQCEDTEKEDPEELLNVRLERSGKATPPLKKKKR